MMSKKGLDAWEIDSELFHDGVHDALIEILDRAEKGDEGYLELREEIRGYLQEDAAWRVELKRHFAKDAPARVKAFLDSVS
jgi:hypothetical protein